MTPNTRKLFEQALALPANERVALVEGILSSLDRLESPLLETWAEEAECRIELHESGLVDSGAARIE